MSKKCTSWLSAAVVAAGFVLSATPGPAAADMKEIRIGWQPTSTVEAQIAHTLAKTDILEKNGLKGKLTMFSYGPAVNEALVSGAVDVGFIGDMPSVALANANASTTVIARQSVFRGSIIASSASGITTMAGLKGKKLYGPVGSSIYLAAMNMLDKAGLKPGKDVQIVHMGFAGLSDGIKAGKVDAIFVWDPWVEMFTSKGLGKVLDSDTSLTMVVAMQDKFLKEHPAEAKAFLKAHKEATLYAASNHAKANGWFREPENARALPEEIVQAATAYDPQWNAKSIKDIRIAFSEAELNRYFGLGKQAHMLKVFPKEPPLAKKTDLSIAKELDANPWSFDPASVKVMK